MDGGTGDPEVLNVRDDMTSYSISSISSSFLAALVKIVAGFFGEGWYADVERLRLEGDDVLGGGVDGRDTKGMSSGPITCIECMARENTSFISSALMLRDAALEMTRTWYARRTKQG